MAGETLPGLSLFRRGFAALPHPLRRRLLFPRRHAYLPSLIKREAGMSRAEHIPAVARAVNIVAYEATSPNVLDLHQAALLGISGKPGKRVAVLRNGSGAVEVAREGDLSSAGIVTEIGASDMRVWRMGEEISFTLPEAPDRPTQPL